MAESQKQSTVTVTVTVPSRTYGFPPEDFDPSRLPDIDTDFVDPADLAAFAQALSAPDDPLQSPAAVDDTSSLHGPRSPDATCLRSTSSMEVTRRPHSLILGDDQADSLFPSASFSAAVDGPHEPPMFITAQNDWAPVHERIHGRRSESGGGGGGGGGNSSVAGRKGKKKKAKTKKRRVGGGRSTDETREGYLYGLLKWPFLLFVGAWIVGLAFSYLCTRAYIALYERLVTLRGRRERLRRNMRTTNSYADWKRAARELDAYLGNDLWKEQNAYAYYNSRNVKQVYDQLKKARAKAEAAEAKTGLVNGTGKGSREKEKELAQASIHDMGALLEMSVKNNFSNVENRRMYSQTYYGTKNLVQNFTDEVEKSLEFLIKTNQLPDHEKRKLFKGLHANYGRTALCLSGGASFAYYHFGVVKALLDQDLLPNIITGTSGGALVAALVATRTNDELKALLVPALAKRITACQDAVHIWIKRWWTTGARFDSVDWAHKCSWFSRGSMTFREAYERTGRILNVSCVPADPHSPTILCNYLTSPDCVIWSAVLASAAVPGILNPVVLLMKTRDGGLVPASLGNRWKDGSLRTDIPIKALNTMFNVNFTIVSQVNPHINLFFFSSRGSVGSPVTHRRGRGWRGGYLGTALEQYLKLDLHKWVTTLRRLELVPRPLGQDWSQLFLQDAFGGTITIWPTRTVPSDFLRILSDPDPARLARMIHEGQQSAFPKVKFIANRLKVERLVERGRRETRPARRGSTDSLFSDEERQGLLLQPEALAGSTTATDDEDEYEYEYEDEAASNGEDGLPLESPPQAFEDAMEMLKRD